MVIHGQPPAWPTWAKDKNEWRDLHNFMTAKKIQSPYPDYLFRYIVPRPDSLSRPTADIGSDAYESSPVPMPIGRAHTDGSVGALFVQLSRQLAKYQNKLQLRASDGYNAEDDAGPPSTLVSLSGSFRWTVQKACKIYRASRESIVPGVAVFDTARAKDVDCVLYRVADLLAWLDERYDDGSGASPPAFFSNQIRYWASNADEYVVWSHVPRAALVSYVPVSTLAPRGELNFLTPNFRRAKDLAALRKWRLVRLSAKKYWNNAADFVALFVVGMRHDLLLDDPARLRVDVLLRTMVCPRQWGFLCLPRSGALPKSFAPDVARLRDFAETTTALSAAWRAQMELAAQRLSDHVLEAAQEMRAASRGNHFKKCQWCEYIPPAARKKGVPLPKELPLPKEESSPPLHQPLNLPMRQKEKALLLLLKGERNT